MRRPGRAAALALALGGLVASAGTLAAGAARPALAGEGFEAGSARAAVESALRGGGPGAAATALDAILAGPRDRERDLEAAQAAMDLVAGAAGRARAAALLEAALRARPSARDAWSLAQTLRMDLVRRVDGAAGEPFLRALIELYPEVESYRRDLALLLLDLGRRDAARAVFEAHAAADPSDPQPHYRLARMDEEDGDREGAARRYAAIVQRWPGDLRAWHLRASVLASMRSPEARGVLAEGLERAAAADSEAERARWTERLTDLRRFAEQQDHDRAAILRMIRMQSAVIAAALAVWAAVLVVACRATRSPAASARD